MDAYFIYNQTDIDHLDAPKMAFMSNHDNYYYYNVMPIRMKNEGAPY